MKVLKPTDRICPSYKGVIRDIAKSVGCSEKTVGLALRGINNTDLTQTIRKRAIEFGCKY